jgi:hypothetical protein
MFPILSPSSRFKENPLIDRVTLTGADDSTDPRELLALSREFPFVEWGILFSRRRERGSAGRFPSWDWIERLNEVALSAPDMKLALHLCSGLSSLLAGNCSATIWDACGVYQRVQLNFHGDRSLIDNYNSTAFRKALIDLSSKQYIFQIDGAWGSKFFSDVLAANDFDVQQVDAVSLFDLSHGAGVLPDAWPKAKAGAYHGYAGGLGPHNLREQLPKIQDAAGDCRAWVDMETHVRTSLCFDLDKVRKCLEIAAPFISL